MREYWTTHRDAYIMYACSIPWVEGWKNWGWELTWPLAARRGYSSADARETKRWRETVKDVEDLAAVLARMPN